MVVMMGPTVLTRMVVMMGPTVLTRMVVIMDPLTRRYGLHWLTCTHCYHIPVFVCPEVVP